jgi:hypothetical protein
MLQLSPARKNKINLADYNSAQDIVNRTLMSDFTPFDLEVLGEILYSPLKISIKKLARTLDAPEAKLRPILEVFAKAELLSIDGDSVLVDKEMRKYFEFQIVRFDSEFRPDLEFMQGLLRRVPIHVLPTWYSLPRSSNNIFESVLEKHLLSPQIYQRYLLDLNFGDLRIQGILDDVLASPNFRVSSSDLIAKYNLSRPDFEEIMLLLEFNLACCVYYIKEEDHWHEVVTPLYEWAQYLRFLKETEAPIIPDTSRIVKRRERDYAFLEDATAILSAIQKKGIPFDPATLGPICKVSPDTGGDYLNHLVEKICLVRLAEKANGKLVSLDNAKEFLEMNWESKALYLYRHTQNKLLSTSFAPEVATERNVRESEKTIRRVLHGGWVYADEFIKGALIALTERSVIMLKKTGKHWVYVLPIYSETEKELMKAVIFELLFEAGLVTVGTLDGRDCFAVTSFGRFFFEE